MNELKIKYLPLESLQQNPDNTKEHDDTNIDAIAKSILAFGFTNPILIADGQIIAGHGRYTAALKLDIEKVPTIDLSHLANDQRMAYAIADNKLAELGTKWNTAALQGQYEELMKTGFDLELTGFSAIEWKDIAFPGGTEGLTDEDAVPDVPEEATTKLGDIYTLGNHRLMCGDSTSIDAVEKLMDGQKADMVFTDPPYGMSYGGGRAKGDHVKFKKSGGIKSHGMIKGDDLKGDDLICMISDAVGSAISVCKSGAAKYVCFPWRTYSEFEAALDQVGMQVSACIVWDKKSIGLGNANYRPQHEFIFYSKGDNWHGDKSQSDVWYNSRGATGAYVHPTQKPVELVEKAISNSTKGQDLVIDVFGGSGSTLIACEKTARDCRMMELDEKYCDVIIKRWEEFTGQTAILEE
jgi:DNA modification methylase